MKMLTTLSTVGLHDGIAPLLRYVTCISDSDVYLLIICIVKGSISPKLNCAV